MCTAATPDTDTAPRADEPCGPPSAASDELAVTTATPAEAAAAEAAAEAAVEAEVPPPAEEPAAETEGPAEEETAAVALPAGEPAGEGGGAAEEEAADEEVVAAGQPAGTAPEVRKLPSTTLSVTLKGDKAQPAMTADLSRRRGAKVKTYSRTIALTITAGTTTTLRELATQGALKVLGPRAAEVALRQEGVLHAERTHSTSRSSSTRRSSSRHPRRPRLTSSSSSTSMPRSSATRLSARSKPTRRASR